MQSTRQLPVPEGVKLVMQEWASDRREAHPTANLIKRLSFFSRNNLKVVVGDFANNAYFILLRDGGWNYTRSFSIAYNPIQTGCNLVIENESNLIINDDYRGIYDVIINLESNIHNILRINERIDNTVENTFIL